MNSIKSFAIDLLKGLPGFHTNRKIVVIESDDWGSLRMPSKETYEFFISQGVKVDEDRYNKYDNLADEDDFSKLFDVLTSVKDSNGNFAKMTPFAIVANPDFDKIKSSGFTKYFYEKLPVTLEKYEGKHANAFQFWKEGITSGIFKPQFHGREHLNIYTWLKALQNNSFEAKLAFDKNVFGLPTDSYCTRKNLYMSAFECDSIEESQEMPEIISDGVKIFDELFGYKPIAFMAPCAIWSRDLEPSLKKAGIKLIQSGPVQYEAKIGKPNQYNKIIRFTGQKNKKGQVFSVRNCSFEPSVFNARNEVKNCLNDIEKAFKWKRPAIISSHRVNFIGNIHDENRNNGLSQLKALLKEIVKRWPDVEFMTTDEYAAIVTNNNIN